MSEIEKKPIKITETVLRDAHQSLIATRMPTEFMLPIVDKMDKVGYHSVECWGGATFDASLRFLKEDPWDRLRKLRDGFKNTKLQMLFRGQNILGYRPYADDVVDYFVQKSISNGIDIIRIFDCLNDLRNLQEAVNATNKFKAQEGRGEAQVALAYTLGDAYTLEYWTSMAKKIEEKLAGNAPVAQTSELNPLDGDVAGSKPKAKMTLRQRQIAEQMFLAEKTVKNYVSSLLSKLGLERRTQAAVLATRLLGEHPY